MIVTTRTLAPLPKTTTWNILNRTKASRMVYFNKEVLLSLSDGLKRRSDLALTRWTELFSVDGICATHAPHVSMLCVRN